MLAGTTMLLFIQVSGLASPGTMIITRQDDLSHLADQDTVVVSQVGLVVHGLGAGVEMAAPAQAVDRLELVHIFTLFTLFIIAQI